MASSSTAYPEDVGMSYEQGERFATAYRDEIDPHVIKPQYQHYPERSVDQPPAATTTGRQAAASLAPLKMPGQQYYSGGSGHTSTESEYRSQRGQPTSEKPSFQSLSQQLSQRSVVVSTPPKDPATNFVLAIFATVLFCPITGALAIMYAVMAKNRVRNGHLGAAEGYGCISLCFSIVSIVIGMTLYITIIVIAATHYRFIQYGYGN